MSSRPHHVSTPSVERRRVPALGGERTVPAPDDIARGYLLLALRLDQRDAGVLDSYTGPADLKAEVDLEQPRPLARLRDDAAALLAAAGDEAIEAARRTWLEAQVAAVAARLDVLAGEPVAYLDQVERSFGVRPAARPTAYFDSAADELEALVPGDGSLDERLVAWDAGTTIAEDRLREAVDRLAGELRRRAADRFGVPEGEAIRIGLVHDQPWSGYHWFDGGGRSRVDLNVDLPIRAPALVRTLAHETYAGHHLEAAWKEVRLVEGEGWLEHTAPMLLTPAAVISEGLADLGPDLLLSTADQADVLSELLTLGEAPVARRGSVSATAELAVAIATRRERLREVSVNAALARWVDGVDHDETLDLLIRLGRMTAERAAAGLRFIEDPRWRTYVHVYYEGRPLLATWVEAAPDGDRIGRFRRLLREPLTPGTLQAL